MKPASDLSNLAEALATSGTRSDARVAMPSRLRDFYELTKPRMNFLVLCTMAVGFYMAPHTPLAASGHWLALLHAIVGTALSAASAAVINQVVERDYDALMPRTQTRPLPGGRITPTEALLLGIAAGIVGVVYLALFVNVLTALLAAITVTSYVFVYTPMKRVSSLNTVIGAIPGAIPPMMGWTAATGLLGPQALALFGILFFWQMPHFLAIAILYRRDYEAGGFKMLPVVDPNLRATSHMIVLYGVALLPAALMPTMLGMAGSVYFIGAILLTLGFFTFCIGCANSKQRPDARKLFFASIIYLPLLLAVMMIDKAR